MFILLTHIRQRKPANPHNIAMTQIGAKVKTARQIFIVCASSFPPKQCIQIVIKNLLLSKSEHRILFKLSFNELLYKYMYINN